MNARWILLVVALLVAVSCLFFFGAFNGSRAAERVIAPDEKPVVAPKKASDQRAAKSDRAAVPEAAKPTPVPEKEGSEALTQEVVRVDPFRLRIRAVDVDVNPVPGATITVLQAKRTERRLPPGMRGKAGKPGNSYSGTLAGAKPLWEGFTDADGRRQLELDVEFFYLEVVKDGVGRSGQLMVWHSQKRESEMLVTLHPEMFIEGVVLRADGMPAVDADVRVGVSGGIAGNRTRTKKPNPCKADAEGKFRVPIEPGAIYRVAAVENGKRSHSVSVSTTDGKQKRVHRVVVRFPGAISIRGVLLDPSGLPVPGKVKLFEKMTLEEMQQREDSPYTHRATANEKGEFRFDVPRFATYMLLGTAKAAVPSPLTDVVVSEARPHAEAEVQVTEPGRITGTVKGESGAPLGSTLVIVSPESGAKNMFSGVPQAYEIYGGVQRVTTGEDGRFVFEAVHPGTKYTLRCRPDPKQREIEIVRSGISVGQDLVITARPGELQSCRIVLRVVSDATGAVLKGIELRRGVERSGGRRFLQRERVEPDEKGRLILEGLAHGKRYVFSVRVKGYGVAKVGPIMTSKDEQEFEVRLLEVGSLLVHVRDDAGLPAAKVAVAVKKVLLNPSGRHRVPISSNGAGDSLFKEMDPAEYELTAYRGGKAIGTTKAVVRPGQQTEVTLQVQ